MCVDELYERFDFYEIGAFDNAVILSIVLYESLALQFRQMVVLKVKKRLQPLPFNLRVITVDGGIVSGISVEYRYQHLPLLPVGQCTELCAECGSHTLIM